MAEKIGFGKKKVRDDCCWVFSATLHWVLTQHVYRDSADYKSTHRNVLGIRTEWVFIDIDRARKLQYEGLTTDENSLTPLADVDPLRKLVPLPLNLTHGREGYIRYT